MTIAKYLRENKVFVQTVDNFIMAKSFPLLHLTQENQTIIAANNWPISTVISNLTR